MIKCCEKHGKNNLGESSTKDEFLFELSRICIED